MQTAFMFWLCLFLLAVAVTAFGRREDERADCAVVCGHRITRQGDPSSSLRARTHKAVELLRDGRVKGLLFTGGRTRGALSEGWAGAQLALSLGVPAQAIALETRSRTTWENFLAARRLMREQGWATCLIVTDPYHQMRCRLIARQLQLRAGSAPVRGGPADRFPWKIYYTGGECGSLLLYALGRLCGWYRFRP